MARISIKTRQIRRIENRSLILLKLFRGEDAVLIRRYMPEITRRREVAQSVMPRLSEASLIAVISFIAVDTNLRYPAAGW